MSKVSQISSPLYISFNHTIHRYFINYNQGCNPPPYPYPHKAPKFEKKKLLAHLSLQGSSPEPPTRVCLGPAREEPTLYQLILHYIHIIQYWILHNAKLFHPVCVKQKYRHRQNKTLFSQYFLALSVWFLDKLYELQYLCIS